MFRVKQCLELSNVKKVRLPCIVINMEKKGINKKNQTIIQVSQ